MNIRFLSTSIISLLLLTAFVLTPMNVSAHLIQYTDAPRAGGTWWALAYTGQTSAPGISSLIDGNTTNINPSGGQNGRSMFAVTSEHAFYDDDFNVHGEAPSINATIISVEVTITAYGALNMGWFSIGNGSWGVTTVPWLANLRDWTETGNGTDTSNWHNSTLFPWHHGTYVGSTWDITDYVDSQGWDMADLRDPNLLIMWTTLQNQSIGLIQIDFLGFVIKYYDVDRSGGTVNTELDYQVNSLVWLLMVFVPAMGLQQAIPKIGFAVGLSLMLVVFGFTNLGFNGITIIGFIGVAVLIYKGE